MCPEPNPQLSLFGAVETPSKAADDPVVKPRSVAAEGLSHSKKITETLRQYLGAEIKVVWTDNRTVLLSQGSGKNKNTLRMHQMFLDADLEVITAVGRYFKTGHKKSGAVVDAFIKSRSHLLMHHEGHLPLNTGKGTHHDLHVIQAALNRIYFNGRVELDIQWGSPRRHRKRRRSIQLGSYDARIERITIHPALDKSFIPEICVARVVHHEMCHHVHPAQRSPSGRRLVHHAEFLEAERQFVGAEEADAWIDRNIDRILRGP